jgi:hypothetical protein
MWGPDFGAKRMATFFRIREVIRIFRGFPALAYSGDLVELYIIHILTKRERKQLYVSRYS